MAGKVGSPQGEGLRAYMGAAPAPTRSVSIGDSMVDNPMTITDAAQLTNVGPPDLTQPPPLPRGLRTSEPPPNPEMAANLAELNQKIGQLTESVGRIKSDYEAKLEEQALNHQVQLLAMQGRRAPVLPQGVDPAQTVTIGDLTHILTSYGNDMQSGLIRQSWDVSPEEELSVLNANPSLANLPEPDKTIFIQKAVALRRRNSGTQPRAAAPTTSSSPQAPGSVAAPVAPQNSRPVAGHIVPMVESGAPSDIGDVTPASVYQAAIQEYREADKIPNRAQRLAAKKAAMKKAQYSMGISDEQLAKMPFTQSI